MFKIRRKNGIARLGVSVAVAGALSLLFFLTLLNQARAYTIVDSSTVNLRTNEAKRIFVSIQNQTNYTWYGSGKTSLYLYGNSSSLKHSSWLKNDLPVKSIDQNAVAPGQLATASFYVQAPSSPGKYTERFLLGDGSAWHKNTVIQITFNVSNQTSIPVASPVPTIDPSTEITVPAANSYYYKAEVTDMGGTEWQVDPGAHMTVTVKIKNRGTRNWNKEGDGGIALLSLQSKSPFWDGSWIGNRFAARMTETAVAGGQSATFSIQLRAPSAPGKYNETFELYVDGISSIEGSRFTLPIAVRMPDQFVLNQNNGNSGNDTVAGGNSVGGYLAKLLLRPKEDFKVSGNATITLNYGIKNVGTAVWNQYSVKLKEVSPNLGDKLSGVKHESWPAANIANRTTSVTEPGHLGLVNFKIKAPAKQGAYNIRFALEADGQEVPGGEINIPVTVTADGYIEPDPAVPNPGVPHTTPSNANLPSEPIIRVGLYKTTDDTMVIRGVSTGYNLKQGGVTVCTFSQHEEVKVIYDRAHAVYKATGPRCQSQSSSYYVAESADGIAPLEVTDFYRPVSWLPGANDNKFRAKLELRYTPATDSVWLINELPIEWYLKGIAETSELSPIEFHKTLLVAARTYAMYHVERATKHANEYFIVDAKYDQVYRGYGQEARSPTIARAIDETRGIVVTYDNKIAITPYFSRSDGRTRDWKEVWYGDVAWCKGVPVPHDEGKTLWGHGVGMSASGALAMAVHDGKTYDYILKYFYTGIQLQPWYR
ncbi:MAG: NBR1-Ig-like domain-containing protein [Patescibacteria group bacterium]